MNKKNLRKLAKYLMALPKDYRAFEMRSFMEKATADEVRDYIAKNGNMCGSCACAVGHGPHAGITLEISDDDWDNFFICNDDGGVASIWAFYCEHAFDITFGNRDFEWFCGGEWDKVDNTPQGAAARILYVLDGNEIPDDFEDSLELSVSSDEAQLVMCQRYMRYMK